MSYIGSSPLPIPTFQDSRDACPKDLLAFIESIITTLKNDTAEEILRTERSKWMSMFNTLNWAVLVTPCQPDEYPWNTMHERVKLLEVSFKVLCSASEQCGDILSHNAELAKSMIVKLLDISTSLDVWLDVTGVPLKAGFPGPGTLRATCTQATIGMLKAFGNGLRIDNAGKPGWHILRDIAEEFFALCRGTFTRIYPAMLSLNAPVRTYVCAAGRSISYPLLCASQDTSWATSTSTSSKEGERRGQEAQARGQVEV